MLGTVMEQAHTTRPLLWAYLGTVVFTVVVPGSVVGLVPYLISLRGTDAQADIRPRLPGLLPIGAALGPALASSRPLGPAMNRGVLHNVDVEFYATCCKAGYCLRLDSN